MGRDGLGYGGLGRVGVGCGGLGWGGSGWVEWDWLAQMETDSEVDRMSEAEAKPPLLTVT